MRVFAILIIYSCLLTAVICRPAMKDEIDRSQENEYDDQYADPDDGSISEVADDSPGQTDSMKQNDKTEPAIDQEIKGTEHKPFSGSKVKQKVKESYKTEEHNQHYNEQGLTNNRAINEKVEADEALQSNNIKSIQTDTKVYISDGHETANKRSKKEIRIENSGLQHKQAVIDNDIKTDEEIIKRQIKKLTNNELDELLNSLSSDKRELLLKIIESSIGNENVEKREAAKKSPSHNFKPKRHQVKDAKELTKDLVHENIIVSSDKDSTIKSQISSINDRAENDPESIRTGNMKVEVLNNGEMKRDANKENVSSQDNAKEDKEYYDQEDPCAFLDQLKNERKREVSQETDHLADSLKSLEDSFSNAYNEVDADLTPHVRVKRKNSDMTVKKRAAYIIDPVQSCVPHEHSNHSHDEEGKEYEDVVPYDSSSYINENRFISNKKDDPNKAKNAKTLGSIMEDAQGGG